MAAETSGDAAIAAAGQLDVEFAMMNEGGRRRWGTSDYGAVGR